ncbi:hypothetical protein DPEC_G00332670 [Dallia pectoralis]|uniref:Uncharacterized protein n=1 Tax=Dallia pectoralis TaxID=75939 RepID=A0ACC2F660_DALPE|nr:hypothetical protein DPEC_G00332670 [Dallia pectoralis]
MASAGDGWNWVKHLLARPAEVPEAICHTATQPATQPATHPVRQPVKQSASAGGGPRVPFTQRASGGGTKGRLGQSLALQSVHLTWPGVGGHPQTTGLPSSPANSPSQPHRPRGWKGSKREEMYGGETNDEGGWLAHQHKREKARTPALTPTRPLFLLFEPPRRLPVPKGQPASVPNLASHLLCPTHLND